MTTLLKYSVWKLINYIFVIGRWGWIFFARLLQRLEVEWKDQLNQSIDLYVQLVYLVD